MQMGQREEAIAFLQLYGLEKALTREDAPQLWAAIVSKLWPLPDHSGINERSLRFGVGKDAPKTEFKIQPFDAWCFERADITHLKLKQCDKHTFTDAGIDRNLKDLVKTPLFNIAFMYPDFPYLSIVLIRPSKNKRRLAVYSGAQFGPRHGGGDTRVWVCQDDGSWQATDEVLASWVS